MISDDSWKQEAIERDMMAAMKKLGKGENIIIYQFYKIKSLGEDKLLKIEMGTELYNLLKEFGINFDDFSKGEKLFEKDRDKFMNIIEMMVGSTEIVYKDFVHKTIFGNDENNDLEKLNGQWQTFSCKSKSRRYRKSD